MADYVHNNFKWGSPTLGTGGGVVEWSFTTRDYNGQHFGFDRVLAADFQAEIRNAFNRWEQVARIDFVEVGDASDNAIRIGSDEIDGPGGILGQAWTSYAGGSVVRSEIHFETDEGWRTSDGRIVTDAGESFYVTALHEIGHTMGLGHHDAEPAVMSTFLEAQLVDLLRSDVAGAQAIYGTPGGSPANAVTSSGTSSAERLTGGTGNDTLQGYGGDDVVTGDSGSDLIIGGDGVDELRGGNGADTIHADGGNESFVSGGNGNDTFVFRGDFGIDSIVDIQFGAKAGNDAADLIVIEIEDGASFDRDADIYTNSAGNVIIDVEGQGQVYVLAATGNIPEDFVNDILLIR